MSEVNLTTLIAGSVAPALPHDATGAGPNLKQNSVADSRIVTVPPLRWNGCRVGKCYNNVQEMIRRKGGEAVYGWALTDFGPHRINGWYPPPLYRRWLNHVVWRDRAGQLREVTPHSNLDKPDDLSFVPTEFLEDESASFQVNSEVDWFVRPSRYIPVRPEGVAIARLLEQAQAATSADIRNSLIKQALAALRDEGFSPREWKVETIGERTGSIWLIAE